MNFYVKISLQFNKAKKYEQEIVDQGGNCDEFDFGCDCDCLVFDLDDSENRHSQGSE